LDDCKTRVREKIGEKVFAKKETVQPHDVEPLFQQDFSQNGPDVSAYACNKNVQ